MKVFHLSHIDLDGYSCQFLAREFFDDIEFYNANYGKEMFSKLNMILDKIESSKPLNTLSFKNFNFQDLAPKKEDQKFIVLITDLNLTLNECKFVDQKINDFKKNGIDAEVILLDHHITGQECANIYKWYHLDIEQCATKITYYYLLKHFKIKNEDSNAWLVAFVEMVNSVDIWLEDGFGFEFGKVAMNMIANSSELNRYMFDKNHRDYKFDLLMKTKNYLLPFDENCNQVQKKGGTIDNKIFDEVAFDNDLFFLKKDILGGNRFKETMDNIISRKQVELLSDIKDNCKVFYNNKIGFLSYSIGGISVLANKFLQDNEEFDFFIDVSARGSVSLRSNDKCDVSLLSQECFKGGGHKNASGGRVEGFKESYFYDDVKEQVQYILDNN